MFEANKLRKRLRRQVGEAIGAYGLIAPHDRVMVCVSGGKDSYGLLDILLTLKGRAPFPFEVIAMNLDQKQPDFPAEVLPRFFESRGIPYRIEEQDTYSVVKRVIPEGGTLCSLCSRLRRGVIYRVATEIGATKIALGHHRDDVIATFFLNLFFGGKLKTMPPKLVSDDGRHVVIRPLVHVRERDLARYAELNEFPIIPCNLCGSQEHLQRKQVTAMLREWEKKYPGPHRFDLRRARQRRAVASHGSRAVRFRRRHAERRADGGRRHRLRRRPGARTRGGSGGGEPRVCARRHRHPARAGRLSPDGSTLNVLESCFDAIRGRRLRVVFPEHGDERIAAAAQRLRDLDLAEPILLAHPEASERLDAYVAAYLEGRPDANPKVARRLAAKPLFHAGLMVKAGDADAMVAGVANTTARVIEAGMMTVGPRAGIAARRRASS